MLSRIVFLAVTLFWLTMNVLLWRAGSDSREAGTSAVPAKLVWEKVLTSPDSSSLSVIHRGTRTGFCHWITSVGEEWANVSEENIPNGTPGASRSYRLRLEGSVIVPELTNRIRFEGSLKVGADRVWQQLDLSVNVRPITWQIHAAAAEQTVYWTAQDGEARFEHTFKFSDLRNPGAILGEFMGPFAGEWLASTGRPLDPASAASLNPGVNWEACEDTLWIGHAQARVYRLQTRLLDRYRISLIVSRVGEILRVELPGDLVLVNDQLSIL